MAVIGHQTQFTGIAPSPNSYIGGWFIERSTGKWFNTDTPVYEAYNAANIADYLVIGVEIGSTGRIEHTVPANLTVGIHRFYAALLATADTLVASDCRAWLHWEDGYWDGTYWWPLEVERGTDNANTTTPLDASGIRTAVGLASANLDTQLAAIVADTNELQGDWADGGRLDLLLDAVVAQWTTALTEDYSTAGGQITPAQFVYEVTQFLNTFSISSTTRTTKKRDGSTTAMTHTLDDATNPTGLTRAT